MPESGSILLPDSLVTRDRTKKEGFNVKIHQSLQYNAQISYHNV